MICRRRLTVLPVEVIVRGYVAGSGWKDYRRTGAICGIAPPGRAASRATASRSRSSPPRRRPSPGTHDENIDFDAMIDRLATARARRPAARSDGRRPSWPTRVRDVALALYGYGVGGRRRAGILLADTKFEFGLTPDGELLLIDEVLTPDSSRFWDAATYEPGRAQASYDKQYVRDWLETQPWDKTAPGPELPDEVVAGTRARYVEAFERITGASFARYLQEDVIGR